MYKIRIGKSFNVKWHILTNGESVPLVGRNLTLIMRTPSGRRVQKNFTIDEGSNIRFIYEGTEHECIGVYSLTLWENFRKANQCAVDYIDAFCLVKSTEEENYNNNSIDETELEYESNLTIGFGGAGENRIGIKDIFVSESNVSGEDNVVTIILDDDREYTFNVKNGKKGDDGNTPVITANKVDDTTTLYANGVSFATIMDGKNGNTPSISASKSYGVTTVYVDGIAIATINDGVNGDSYVLTEEDKVAIAALVEAKAGVTSWNDLTDKPTIPSKTSELENDSNFLTEHQSLEGYATKDDLEGKQDKIEDIESIREGAGSGAEAKDIAENAAQKVDELSRKVTGLQESVNNKADKVSDATEIADNIPLPNTTYKLGEIASLSLASIPNSNEETLIYWTCAEGFTMTIPDCEIVGELSAEDGKSYVMSILNGIVVMGEVEHYTNA